MRLRFRLLIVALLLLLPAPSFAQPRVPAVAEYCDDGFINNQKLFFKSIGKNIGDNADRWEADVQAVPGFIREHVVPGQMIDISRGSGLRIQWRSGLVELAPIVFTPSTNPQQSTDAEGKLLLWYTVTRQFIRDDVNRVGYVHGRDFVYSWDYIGGDVNAEVRVPCAESPTPVPVPVPTPTPQPTPAPVPAPAPAIDMTGVLLRLDDLVRRVDASHADLTAQHKALEARIDAPGWLERIVKHPITIAALSVVGGWIANAQIN